MGKYIAISGCDGTGKTTAIGRVEKALIDSGYSVIVTKELGTHHNEATMILRDLALNGKWGKNFEGPAREFVAQAARAINYEQVVLPALRSGVDFVIQDRSLLCSLAYGSACGNSPSDIETCFNMIFKDVHYSGVYDHLFVLEKDPDKALEAAVNAKEEFKGGDAIESKGAAFQNTVNHYYKAFKGNFANMVTIDTEKHDKAETSNIILNTIL